MKQKGNKRVTITGIAKELGLSPTTVSYVLRGQAKTVAISDKTAERIKNKAKAMGYVPNVWASNLRNQKGNTITVILTDLTFNWAQRVMNGISSPIRQAGLLPVTCLADPWSEDLEFNINMIMQRIDQGIIIHPIAKMPDLYKLLPENNIPIVFLGDIPNNYHGIQNVNSVIWNDEPAVEHAVQFLIKKGYKKIGFWGMKSGVLSDKRRFNAYKKALSDAGHEICNDRIYWVELAKITSDNPLACPNQQKKQAAHDLVKQALKNLLSNKSSAPDVILTLNDVTAYTLIDACHRLGIKIPDDLAIIGIGNLLINDMSMINLTSIDEPLEALGRKSAEVLLDIINNPQKQPIHETVEHIKIVERNSA